MSEQQTWVDAIDWSGFDAAKVDSELLRAVKAAALVEFNGHDYGTYLCNVFQDDPDFQRAARDWAEEEVLHGVALGSWAQRADPTWDFEGAVKRFRAGYQVPQEVQASVRGTRAGELVARCIVEVGTSSFYTAFAEAMPEPVFKRICTKIASDEFRHYKLFYTHLKRYLDKDKISRMRRILIALSRIGETEDDELAFAFYAANCTEGQPYDRKVYSSAYLRRAASIYSHKHLERAAAMTLKAAGFDPQSRVTSYGSRVAYWFLRNRKRRLDRAAAATEPFPAAA